MYRGACLAQYVATGSDYDFNFYLFCEVRERAKGIIYKERTQTKKQTITKHTRSTVCIVQGQHGNFHGWDGPTVQLVQLYFIFLEAS